MPICACKHTDTLGVQTLYWGGEGEGEGRGGWVGGGGGVGGIATDLQFWA